MFSSFPSKADGIAAAAEKTSVRWKEGLGRVFSCACAIPCRCSPAGKGDGRRQHHFLAGKMQLHSDLKLLCCLLQTTVIAVCALSSICRSFPPFRETLIAEVFHRDEAGSALSIGCAGNLPLPFAPFCCSETAIRLKYQFFFRPCFLIRHG